MKPHDYQVILQASFGGSRGDPQRVYVDDRKAHPDVLLYTLRAEEFVLPDLFPPASGGKRIFGRSGPTSFVVISSSLPRILRRSRLT